MIEGMTLDSGALIALERGDRRMWGLLDKAIDDEITVTVPVTTIAEAWRGGHGAWLSRLLDTADAEDVDGDLARRAGELLARTGCANAIDALVAVSAAQRGDIVVTCDADDLQRLADDLGTIRVWAV